MVPGDWQAQKGLGEILPDKEGADGPYGDAYRTQSTVLTAGDNGAQPHLREIPGPTH